MLRKSDCLCAWLGRCSIALLSLACLSGAVRAQSLEGEWTNAPDSCGHYSTNNGNVRIDSTRYMIFESGCDFTGGTKVSPSHWVMRASCWGEGPDPAGPPIDVELDSSGGSLVLKEAGHTTVYAMKCAR
jgi:hypothetical protein